MNQLDAYRAYDSHRRTRGPGPALRVNDAILERGAAALAGQLNRTHKQRGDEIKKIASTMHNGRQRTLDFERDAQRREIQRQQAEHGKLGDQLKATLQALRGLSERLNNATR